MLADYGTGEAMTELISMINDLRYDLTIQVYIGLHCTQIQQVEFVKIPFLFLDNHRQLK